MLYPVPEVMLGAHDCAAVFLLSSGNRKINHVTLSFGQSDVGMNVGVYCIYILRIGNLV